MFGKGIQIPAGVQSVHVFSYVGLMALRASDETDIDNHYQNDIRTPRKTFMNIVRGRLRFLHTIDTQSTRKRHLKRRFFPPTADG